ncbi:hypothetical protein HDU80_000950 [Chytriomyces hyalinus]|nr:hypothetical protein HDU80_000950 [Chytriomyces hyalinus]
MKTVERDFSERASEASGREHGMNEREPRFPRSSTAAAEPTSQTEPRSDFLEPKFHKTEPPRPVLNDIAFTSAETIIVTEDQEHQQFFNETTRRPPTDFVSQPSFTPKGTIPRRPTTSTFFINERRSSSGQNLPSNLKTRKLSTPPGSITANGISDFDGALDVKSDPFFSSNLSCSLMRERFNIARPVNPDNQTTPNANTSSPAKHEMQQNLESQGFTNRQSLIHTSTASFTLSNYTSATATHESALSEAKIVKPHSLGVTAATPSVTQIPVITSTRAMGSESCVQSSLKAAVFKKSAVELDHLIPPPPPVAKVDGLGSGEEAFEDQDEESFEDRAAGIVSSKAGHERVLQEKKASDAVTTFDACDSA